MYLEKEDKCYKNNSPKRRTPQGKRKDPGAMNLPYNYSLKTVVARKTKETNIQQKIKKES